MPDGDHDHKCLLAWASVAAVATYRVPYVICKNVTSVALFKQNIKLHVKSSNDVIV